VPRHRTDAGQFFGIKLETRRVLFVLDVSGSMQDPIADAEGGKEVTRLERASAELERCLDELDEKSFFNLITFAQDVAQWKERITELTPETLAEAKEFVRGFRAGGGTNLFGGLKAAFQDLDADTIYVLTDGEPTVGEIVDPAAIRSTIASWNQRRGVKIHAISLGAGIRVLQWLAEDSGGTYLELR
jgi:Mg-chelatase subunit ChlD